MWSLNLGYVEPVGQCERKLSIQAPCTGTLPANGPVFPIASCHIPVDIWLACIAALN